MAPQNPFAPHGSRAAFFAGAAALVTLRRLDEGLGEREPFLVVTGEAGTGKSTLVAEALARWGPRILPAWVAFAALPSEELVAEIVRRFGGEPPDRGGLSRLLASFERALDAIGQDSRVAMLVIDDADALAPEALESLRLLANVAARGGRRFEVLLVGLPALEARLEAAPLAPLLQRVAVRVRIEPLPASEVGPYLHQRVAAVGGDGAAVFADDACLEIASLSEGVPRLINELAASTWRTATAAPAKPAAPVHVRVPEAAPERVAPVVPMAPPRMEAVPPAPAAPSPVETRAKAPVSSPVAPRPAEVKLAPPPARVVPVETPAPAPSPIALPAPSHADEVRVGIAVESQNPREWVARFVGDKGPLQFGVRPISDAAWVAPPAVATPEPDPPAAAGAGPRAPRPHPQAKAAAPHRRGANPLVPMLVIALVAFGGTMVLMRSGLLGRLAHLPSPAVPVHMEAPAPATAVPAVEAPRRATPVSAPATPAARAVEVPSFRDEPAPETAPVEAAAKPRRPFTVEVGGRADLESAMAERDRLASLTGIQGWVVPDSLGGYRVVLGMFRSEERAAAAAAMLVNTKTLDQDRVVPLAPPRLRQ